MHKDSNKIKGPLGMLAELTHRCPLKCLYCSNPLTLIKKAEELVSEQWQDVFKQAAGLGVLQVHLSGGEPLLREDLVHLVQCLNDLDLYSNLVTSGIGLTADKLDSLEKAGLNSIQISIQSFEELSARKIAGVDVFETKLKALELGRQSDLYLTINVVLNRLNLEYLDEIISLSASFEPDKIELANCQYHGWALKNREALLPSKTQITGAHGIYQDWQKKLPDKVELVWVYSDYYTDYPKPCMGGWAQRQMTVTPSGLALPCPDAAMIENLVFENVKDTDLRTIWYDSPGFNAFRGFDWMKEPCRSCEKRFEDFGGCRCQAFALTGDAANTDPACHLSLEHGKVAEAVENIDGDVDSKVLYYRY